MHGVAEIAQAHQRASRRWLSRWCRPIDGSSRMYMTPTSPEPIWLASRMRCASPPRERLGAAIERQVVEADVAQEAQAVGDLLDDLVGDLAAPARRASASLKNCSASLTAEHRDLGQRALRRRNIARGAVQARAAALGAGLRAADTSPAPRAPCAIRSRDSAARGSG